MSLILGICTGALLWIAFRRAVYGRRFEAGLCTVLALVAIAERALLP